MKEIFAQILLAPNSNNSNDYLCCDVSNSYHLSALFVGVNPTRNKTMGGAEKGRKFRARSQPKSADGHITPVFVGQLLSQGWHIQNRPHFEREELWIIYFSKEVASICWYRIYTPNQNYVACENVIKKTTKKNLSSKGPRHDRNDATKKTTKKTWNSKSYCSIYFIIAIHCQTHLDTYHSCLQSSKPHLPIE